MVSSCTFASYINLSVKINAKRQLSFDSRIDSIIFDTKLYISSKVGSLLRFSSYYYVLNAKNGIS
jgi:hypothetical protein